VAFSDELICGRDFMIGDVIRMDLVRRKEPSRMSRYKDKVIKKTAESKEEQKESQKGSKEEQKGSKEEQKKFQ